MQPKRTITKLNFFSKNLPKCLSLIVTVYILYSRLEKQMKLTILIFSRRFEVIVTPTCFQPVFLSKKLEDELKITEKKPSIVNQQRVVYQFNVVRNINLIHAASRNISLINTIVSLIISISTLKSYENVRLNMTV